MKKLILGLCLCLGLTFLAGISTQEIYAAEKSGTSSESSIKSAKEKLFEADADALIEEDSADDLQEDDTLKRDDSGDLQLDEDSADVAAFNEPKVSDGYTYLVEGLSDTDDLSDTPDPSNEDEDLRQALAALEEKIEKEGLLSATRAAKSTIWGEANELSIREEMVQFALQYVGNPYVWGGTSLTNGADCSGFVLAVHNHFGYALPRVAADQYAASRKKDISALEPGDLVFYGNGISHVAMYIGDGQIVHAANSRLGIIVSEITWMNPVGGGTFLD